MYVRLSLSLLGALQTHDKGDLHLQLLCGLDDTLGDVIATHDTFTKIGQFKSDGVTV